jgi:putative heme iron utilization protein
MTVDMVTYFISLVKDTQEIRDQQLQRVEQYQKIADQMTEEATGAIKGLRAMQGKLGDVEAEAVLAKFLEEVDNHGEEVTH